MATKPNDGALIYVDQQIESLRKNVPAALDAFDMTGIHQARVATRRLKSAINLLESTADPKSLKPLIKSGRKLRRRLGPLRDLDVMIDHLKEIKITPKQQPALDWLIDQLQHRRIKVREEDARQGKDSLRLLAQFDNWWIARQQILAHLDSIHLIVTHALHDQFECFSKLSNSLTSSEQVIDVHELRIIGKELRYTFEIAEVQGLKIPRSIFKTFKAMQESLGVWHDYVVLTETTLQRMSKTQIAHHNPELGAILLDLARRFIVDSGKSLNHFKTQWKNAGEKIEAVLRVKAPLSQDVANQIEWDQVKLSQTDPDPAETPTMSPQESEQKDVPPVS